MPRKPTLVLTVEDWVEFDPDDTWYAIQVLHLERSQTVLAVRVKFLDPIQAGRELTLSLPSVIRPSNLTALLLAACGIPLIIGQSIDILSTVGKTIRVKMALSNPENKWNAVDFNPIQEGDGNATSSQ